MLARHSRNLGEVIGRAFEVFPTLCHPFTHKFTPMFTPHHRPDRQAEAPHLVHPQATTRVQIHRHRPPGHLSVRQGITPHLAEPSPATLDHWRPETVAACVVVVSGVVHGAAGAQAGGSGDDGTPPTMQAPPPGLMHEYVRYEGGRSHNCTYCGNKCYWYCATCAAAGYGTMAVCGPKCKGNCCRQQHTDGAPRHHGSWNMTQQGAAAVTRARQERASGTADDADDDGPMGPISPSARRSGPRARAR